LQDNSTACLPQNDPDPSGRAAAVAVRYAGFIYGPSLIGQAAFFPNGTLGNARVADDMALWGVDRAIIDADVQEDVVAVVGAIQRNGGLNSLQDYISVLYHDEWNNSNPLGTAPGIMTNYTQVRKIHGGVIRQNQRDPMNVCLKFVFCLALVSVRRISYSVWSV
jgi:hypothetical protein